MLPGSLVGGEAEAEGRRLEGQRGRGGKLQQELGAGIVQEAELKLSQLWELYPQLDQRAREGHWVILYCGSSALGVSQMLDWIFFFLLILFSPCKNVQPK